MLQVIRITCCLHTQINIRCGITAGSRDGSLHESCTGGVKGGRGTMAKMIPCKFQFGTISVEMEQGSRIRLFAIGTNPVCNAVTQCFGFQGECKGAIIGRLPCIGIHTGCSTGSGFGHGNCIIRCGKCRESNGLLVGTDLADSCEQTRSSLLGRSSDCIIASMDRIRSGTAGADVDIIHCIGSFHRHKAYEIHKIYTECLNDFSHKAFGDVHSGNGVALCIYFAGFGIHPIGFGIASGLSHIIGF